MRLCLRSLNWGFSNRISNNQPYSTMKDNRYQIYEDFQKEFPISDLEKLPLGKYTNLNREDSFCYWVESKTSCLGSIWGGTSYKFGIYEYEKKPNNPTVISQDDYYAWYRWYDVETSSEAYEKVLDSVVRIAKAARRGSFNEIDKDDYAVGGVFKWKIAFLYSNLQLIPIFKKEMLVKVAQILGVENAAAKSVSELQTDLMVMKGEMDLFEFYDHLLTRLDDYSEQNVGETGQKYWIYAPGPDANMWDEFYESGIMGLGWERLGDFKDYTDGDVLRDSIEMHYGGGGSHNNDKCAIWDFANNIAIGDIVIVKKGRSKLIGRGVVTSEYYFDEDAVSYNSRRKVNWTHKGEWTVDEQLVMKTLTDITKYKGYPQKLEAIMGIGVTADDNKTTEGMSTIYTKENFLQEVYMASEMYDELLGLLQVKKNIILQGAPGVGKTFCAERLAYSIMGKKDQSRIKTIQFHQNYSYEDFIMGYKPDGDSFKLRNGIFYNFCIEAINNPNEDYFFIIDEINRGNLSKIFGELLMMIEKDYRGKEITLAYSDQGFHVPENLYIIGMMNTADRSLALIDYALRRRFSFFDMKPGYESEGFKSHVKAVGNKKLEKVVELILELNAEISKDDSLGSGFEIGHSYFCGKPESLTDATIKGIVKYDIIPTIREYWFDNEKKANDWSDRIIKALND